MGCRCCRILVRNHYLSLKNILYVSVTGVRAREVPCSSSNLGELCLRRAGRRILDRGTSRTSCKEDSSSISFHTVINDDCYYMESTKAL